MQLKGVIKFRRFPIMSISISLPPRSQNKTQRRRLATGRFYWKLERNPYRLDVAPALDWGKVFFGLAKSELALVIVTSR
jgi:hypothetical protein